MRRIQIGSTVINTSNFDDSDLDIIINMLECISENEMISAKMYFNFLISSIQIRNALRNYLEGLK